MKKFLSVLLALLIFVSMLSESVFAYSEFDFSETDGHICGFVYKIDDKVFFSDSEAIKELAENGETTVYLPEECRNIRAEIHFIVYNYSDYGMQIEVVIPGSAYCKSVDEKVPFDYLVNFACSQEAEYDFKNQIGTSALFKYLGYYDSTINKVVFLNGEELDTLIKTKKLSLEDDDIKVFDNIDFISDTSFGTSPSGGSVNTHNRWVNRIEFSQLFNDGADEYKVVVNENASVFDDNCLFGMLKGIFSIIFENVLKFIIYS